MQIILSLLFVLLFVEGGVLLFAGNADLPPRKTNRYLQAAISRKRSMQEVFVDAVIAPLQIAVTPFVKLGEEREGRIKYSLARAGITETPAEYYAKGIALALISAILPVVLFLIGVRTLAFISILLVPTVFLHSTTSYRDILEEKKKKIEAGLPHFIRAILYKLRERSEGSVKVDLIGIFEDYLKIAPEAFQYDISVLIMEMKAKDIESALRSFNSRLGIPEVTFLVNALIGLTRGEPQNEALTSLARQMDIKSKEAIQRELAKRPRKVYIACIPMFIVGFLAIIYVLLIAVTQGIAELV